MLPASLNIHLLEPYWLLLTPVVLLSVVIGKRVLRWPSFSVTSWLQLAGTRTYRHPLLDLIVQQYPGSSRSGTQRYLQVIILMIILLLLSISLAQPYRKGKQLPDPPQHRDVIFLLNTSVSMVLRDYIVDDNRIDRLTMLKNVLTHFVDQLQGNRIQFIAFAENAYTLVPLTSDHALLKYQLQRLQAASLTGRSSDPSQAILYALQTQQQTTAQDARPVFVMLTDASRPRRHIDPRIAAQLVAEHGIRLHIIAVGAGSYAAEDTAAIALIYHPASFQLLEDIARFGNGQFFWAKDPATLTKALLTIQQAEKRRISAEPVYITQPVYFWPLGAALLLILVSYVLSLLRQGSHR